MTLLPSLKAAVGQGSYAAVEVIDLVTLDVSIVDFDESLPSSSALGWSKQPAVAESSEAPSAMQNAAAGPLMAARIGAQMKLPIATPDRNAMEANLGSIEAANPAKDRGLKMKPRTHLSNVPQLLVIASRNMVSFSSS